MSGAQVHHRSRRRGCGITSKSARRGHGLLLRHAGLARFRCSAYQHLGKAGIAMPASRQIPTIAELHLPPVVSEIAHLAARADAGHRHHRLGQIDHAGGDDRADQPAPAPARSSPSKTRSNICTRPSRRSSRSSKSARTRPASSRRCARALRQDPDVVLVGELRDMDTLRIAAARRRHGAPGLLDRSLRQRAADDRAHHRDVPARRAQAAADAAGRQPGGDHLAAAADLPRRLAPPGDARSSAAGRCRRSTSWKAARWSWATTCSSAGGGQQTFDQELLNDAPPGADHGPKRCTTRPTPRRTGGRALRGISFFQVGRRARWGAQDACVWQVDLKE